MKLFFISAVLCFNLTFTQTVYESIESNALGVKRELKIQLPRNYESNPARFILLNFSFQPLKIKNVFKKRQDIPALKITNK